ncbi:MAG TPA: DUF2079 domain-containing protein [Acidimicrobiales bacterium]
MATRRERARQRYAPRRRYEAWLRRVQARIDGEWADRVVPWAAAGVLFVVLGALALAHAGELTGGQVGAYAQAAWLVAHGHEPFVTVRGVHLLAEHAPFGFYPVAVVAGFLPAVPTLLLVQSAALAVAVVPLWQLCRRVMHLRAGASSALVAAWALHPAVHNMNLAGFHPETLAVPAMVAAAAAALARRWWVFAGAAAVAVLLHAELGLVVAAAGAVWAVRGRRAVGIAAVVAGLAWVAFATLVVGPSVSGGEVVATRYLGSYGDGAGEVVRTMLANPGTVATDLFTQRNLDVVVGLLAPLLFLPLLAPRVLLAVVPLQALYLVSSQESAHGIGDHHVAAATAVVFVAAAAGLGRAGRKGVVIVTVERSLLTVLLAASGFAFLQSAASSPSHEPWEWGRDTPVERARQHAASMVPDDAPVSASLRVLPPLAERRQVFTFPAPYVEDAAGDPESEAERRAAVRWVVVDTTDRPTWSDTAEEVYGDLAGLGFVQVDQEAGVEVWTREGD